MTTSYDIPLPGDTVDGATVIASTYLTDDTGTLIMLNPTPPYFTVAEIRFPVDDSVSVENLYAESHHRNIVYAVREYEQRGGDV